MTTAILSAAWPGKAWPQNSIAVMKARRSFFMVSILSGFGFKVNDKFLARGLIKLDRPAFQSDDIPRSAELKYEVGRALSCGLMINLVHRCLDPLKPGISFERSLMDP